MRQANEPSVEEILESIKKVIARDNRVAPPESRPEPRPEMRAEPRRPAAPPAPSAFDPETFEDEDEEVLDLAGLSEPDPLPPPLIADNAVASMRESLAALASVSGPGMAPQIVRSGETSLEGLVREMLRPMLAEWLDKNLPPLVERLVAAEISRIVGKKG
jgi:cell pole-organizing protein PopZ